MGLLRLYKKFYCVSKNITENLYTPITPLSISASSFIAGTGGTESNTMIESNIPLTEEEIGIFYADLNPVLYSSDVTYDLVFYVTYTTNSPVDKKLITRFRIMPFNITNQLDFEINNLSPIEFEINNSAIEYEILGTYN